MIAFLGFNRVGVPALGNCCHLYRVAVNAELPHTVLSESVVTHPTAE